MDKIKKYTVRSWIYGGGAFIVFIVFNMPGCIDRHFPPLRDPQFYTLELYLVRFSSHVGRQHPEIADVIGSRRTKLLKQFSPLNLDMANQGQSTTFFENESYRAQLEQIQNGIATIHLELKGDPLISGEENTDLTFRLDLPCDTWGVRAVSVDSRERTVEALVYRLNSPANH